MQDKRRLESLAQTPEDRILLARVWERLTMGMQRNIPAYTAFLSPREQALTRQLMGQCRFFGGYAGAERAIACYLPDYLDEDCLMEDGPVVCLRAEFYTGDKLSHRDFLGSLMGAGIKRETVGDILVGQGRCDFFLLAEIAPYVEQNLISAGRTHLQVSRIPLAMADPGTPDAVTVRDTLASLRLDSVVSAGFRISRTVAARHIAAGATAIDGLPCEKPDKGVEPGNVITVRGLGKLRLTNVQGQSRKGRIWVEMERYGRR